MSHNCFPFTPIIMKLHTKTPHESRMCTMDFGVKGHRSRSQCIDYWKCLKSHNCFPFTPIIMKLNTKTHLMRPMDFGGQRLRSQCSDYWKWILAHNCLPFISAIIKLHAQIPCESRVCLNDIGVKKTWRVWIGCPGGGGGCICPIRSAPF